MADKLGIPMSKVLTNLKEHGNTSAGTIPLCLDEAVRTGQVKSGDIVAMAGFGAGLSWGAAVVRCPLTLSAAGRACLPNNFE